MAKLLIALVITIIPVNVYAASQKTVSFKSSFKYIGLYWNEDLKNYINVKNASKNEVIWTSSNSKVAIVNNKGIVTALRKGKVTITASLKNGNSVKRQISCESEADLSGPTLELDKKSLSLKEKTSSKLKATAKKFLFKKVNGSYYGNLPTNNILWTSSNTSIAKVDSNGKVTAVKAGKATITVIGYGHKINCTVTVKKK